MSSQRQIPVYTQLNDEHINIKVGCGIFKENRYKAQCIVSALY
jgi:hypothetical protein